MVEDVYMWFVVKPTETKSQYGGFFLSRAVGGI